MRTTRLLILVTLLAVAVPAVRAGYELLGADEFDGVSLEAANWTRDTYHGVVRSARDAGFYTGRPENVRVSDGYLTIVARKEAYDLAAYTTARVHTYGKRALTYGRVSVRMKAPAVPGLRPQVSLLPVELTYGSWPASGGIDIVNINIAGGVVTSGLHFGGSGPRGTHVENRSPKTAGIKPDEDFHVYTVEWQPYEIRWYVDDELTAVQDRWWSSAAPNPAPFDRPFYVAIGLAVEAPDAGQLDNWPYSMEVDWIRVYQAQGNRAPEVELISPAPGANMSAGQSVTLRADASDVDDNLVGVEFYSGDQRLALDRDEPFSFEWSPADGCYDVIARAVDEDGFGRSDNTEIIVGKGCPPTPFHGRPAAIPGRIEAEDFDKSRKNDAYFDTDASNNGGAYRLDCGVDIQPCSAGGFNLGWMIAGEWTRYTVAVTEAGKYDVRCRVASPNDTARIHLELDGTNITGPLPIPNTGDWQNFTDVVVRGVSLAKGEQVLRMVVESEGLNLDYVEFTRSGDN